MRIHTYIFHLFCLSPPAQQLPSWVYDAIVMIVIIFCEIHQPMRGISKPNTLVVVQLHTIFSGDLFWYIQCDY